MAPFLQGFLQRRGNELMAGPGRPNVRNDVRIALLGNLTARRQRALREIVRSQGLEHPWPMHVLSQTLRMNDRLREAIQNLPDDEGIDSLLEEWGSLGLAFIPDDDPSFPNLLREIPDAPTHLFVAGSGASPQATDRSPSSLTPRVAVVGSRAASDSGRRLTRRLSRDLAASGCVVISGMARGIDGQAHEGALDVGGRTEAVLGTGLDVIYPPEHSSLYDRLLETGRIWSEFVPGTQPLPLHFPRRNRILVGLAHALVVVEGNERSGARSSVDHALDQGREVMAVPRDPSHPGAELPNRLLKEGARPVTSADDVLEALQGDVRFPPAELTLTDASSGCTGGSGGADPQRGPGSSHDSDPKSPLVPEFDLNQRDPVRQALSAGAATLDELVERCGAPSLPGVLQRLTELELLGWAVKGRDGRWRPGRV